MSSRRRGPWRSLEAVDFATLEWVEWFNNRRLLEPIGNMPPAEACASSSRAQRSIMAIWSPVRRRAVKPEDTNGPKMSSAWFMYCAPICRDVPRSMTIGLIEGTIGMPWQARSSVPGIGFGAYRAMRSAWIRRFAAEETVSVGQRRGQTRTVRDEAPVSIVHSPDPSELRIAVIGAGITGVTTAYNLARRGCRVTLFEQHPYAAMETSFANGGQLSASNAEVWNSWTTVFRGLRWMLRPGAPLLLSPKPSWHKREGAVKLQQTNRDGPLHIAAAG
jgi:hypothetical protein